MFQQKKNMTLLDINWRRFCLETEPDTKAFQLWKASSCTDAYLKKLHIGCEERYDKERLFSIRQTAMTDKLVWRITWAGTPVENFADVSRLTWEDLFFACAEETYRPLCFVVDSYTNHATWLPDRVWRPIVCGLARAHGLHQGIREQCWDTQCRLYCFLRAYEGRELAALQTRHPPRHSKTQLLDLLPFLRKAYEILGAHEKRQDKIARWKTTRRTARTRPAPVQPPEKLPAALPPVTTPQERMATQRGGYRRFSAKFASKTSIDSLV